SFNNPRSVDFLLYSTPIIFVATVVSLKLLPRKNAVFIWQASFALAILMIINGFHESAYGFFLIALPFLSIIAASWRANLLVGGLVIGLVIWDAYTPWGAHMLAPYSLAISFGLIFAVAIGWFVIDLINPLIYWSLDSQSRAMAVIEKSRDERQKFMQIQ